MRVDVVISSGQFKEHVDELNLTPNIFPAYPTSLPLTDHVHGFVALNRSPCCLEFSKALLGVDAAFDRSVILLQDIVQVLHRSVPTAAAKDSFLLYVGDGRIVNRRPIRVDDARLRMGRMAERLLRNRRLAASASRNPESKKSMVAPAESMARYR
jgi:hypothetical protein